MLLWEMFSGGVIQYPSTRNHDIVKFLKNGERMEPPDNCPDIVYAMMMECWVVDPDQRPTMTELREKFEGVITSLSSTPVSI